MDQKYTNFKKEIEKVNQRVGVSLKKIIFI